MFVGVGCTSDS